MSDERVIVMRYRAVGEVRVPGREFAPGNKFGRLHESHGGAHREGLEHLRADEWMQFTVQVCWVWSDHDDG